MAEKDHAHQPKEQKDEQEESEDATEGEETEVRMQPVTRVAISIAVSRHGSNQSAFNNA